ncbi:hypothetical protein LCGC14_2176870 [marine sediment metagenome]|uniref:Uncharacterized protein n=1 Tax=marine sediment metagenome TaxID=412755 RepID=A0A0F9G149_9ZZZZ
MRVSRAGLIDVIGIIPFWVVSIWMALATLSLRPMVIDALGREDLSDGSKAFLWSIPVLLWMVQGIFTLSATSLAWEYKWISKTVLRLF